MTKKRVLLLVIIAGGIAATLYTVSVATKNFAVLALSPLALGFLACPLMCGLMGGIMWLSGRLSRKKENVSLQEHTGGCCQHDHDHNHINENHYENKGANTNIDYPNKQADSIEIDYIIDSDLNVPDPSSKTKF